MKSNTTISIDEQILDEARAFAKSERRSLSSQIEVWIADKLGIDAPKDEEIQPETAEA